MTSYLQYRLVNGFVHNWLVAGPHNLLLPNLDGYAGEEKGRLHRMYQNLPEVERNQTLDPNHVPNEMVDFEVNGAKWQWRYQRCMDDHLVDLSSSYPLWNYLSAWAYTILKLPSGQKATLVLTTTGPANLWLNHQPVYRHEDFAPGEVKRHRIEVDFVAGENQILVRFEMLGVRECSMSMALEVQGISAETDEDGIVHIPTQARYPQRHIAIEETFEKAYLDEVVNYRGAHFNLRWAEDLSPQMKYAYNVQDKDGFQYVEGFWETDIEKPTDVGHTYRLREQPYFVALRPILLEYFEHNLRYEKKFPLHVLDNQYSSAPAGTLAERTREALEDATKHSSNLFGEIAKLALGRWADFNSKLILDHVQIVNRRESGSNIILLGLLGIMHRYMNDPNFPSKLQQPLKECVLNYKYWLDESAGGSSQNDGLNFNTESDQIIFHTCSALAGQLFPRHTFSHSGHKGQWQRKKGEELALEWLRVRGMYGFQEWDSNEAYEKNLAALSHLASLSENVSLCELAAVLMDKIFFSMAVNSYKGSFGSSHGSSGASMLKSSQLEATSGISRMMWGMGVFNGHILGTVSLATSNYEFPLLIGDIANDVTKKAWIRERNVVDHQRQIEVNRVTYKTPEYMLSSAQDYRPGEPGATEHIWQATLGSDAIVFTNHPTRMDNLEEHQPGFWLGNGYLPRVAQWKDVLVAIYHLPEEDWLGFTHAYFPIYSFSEYEIRKDQKSGQSWAFARKDNGYLALSAAQGFELIKRAPEGYRELRSYGKNNAWLCHMGSAENEGSFEAFKKRIMTLKVSYDGHDLRFKTLRGEYLSFGWDAPLMVNSKEKPIKGFKHHESPFGMAELPASQLDIQANDMIIRLNFA